MTNEELLKALYETVRNHQPSQEDEKMFRDDMEKLTFITGRVEVVNQIVKFAKENGVELMSKSFSKEPEVHSFIN